MIFSGSLCTSFVWVWEVKIDMSGQSNDYLRVCNVKMKNFLWGGNRAHFQECMGYRAVASTDLNFFHGI